MKHILFLFMLIIRRIVYLSLGLYDRIFLRKKNNLFILSYHSIASDTWRFGVDKSTFTKQIDYLTTHYDFVTLRDVALFLQGKKKFTRPSVVLTIDDGYKDVLSIKSYLAKKQITPALFLLSNTRKPNWKELGTKRAFLSPKDVKALHKAGWEIGCHSATHANLADVTQQDLIAEISIAKKDLQKIYGFPLRYFAYPRGKYNPATLREVKKARFALGLTMDDGFITRKSDVLRMPRIGIDRTHSFSEFKVTFSPSVVRFRQMIKQTVVGRYL